LASPAAVPASGGLSQAALSKPAEGNALDASRAGPAARPAAARAAAHDGRGGSVLLLEALRAIGPDTPAHAGRVEESLLSGAGPRKPRVIVEDLNLVFERSPREIIRYLKENNVVVINISGASGSHAIEDDSVWPRLPMPGVQAPAPGGEPRSEGPGDFEQRFGLERRLKAIEAWEAVLGSPEVDVNLVVAAPNHPRRDGGYRTLLDLVGPARKDGGIQYDHVAPFHPQPHTVFPWIDLDSGIPGTALRFLDKVLIVGGTWFRHSGYGPQVRVFTSPRWAGDLGNSFAAPKIAGLLWRLRDQLGLGAAQATRLLQESISRPYRYRRAGETFISRVVRFTRSGFLNRWFSDRHLRRARKALDTAQAVPPDAVDGYTLPDLSRFSIPAETARTGAEALRDLLAREGLPRVLVNRNADDALRVLQRGDFGTLHTIESDRPDLPPEVLESFKVAAARRRAIEERRGTFGEGEAAGRTVYGSVHLSERVGSERFLRDILEGLSERERPTKPAQGFYLSGGAVTFVMKPSALAKATFLGGDSFLKNDWEPVGIRRLPEVIMTALARIASGMGEADQLQALLAMPADARREALRRALDSDIFQIDYVEAQIRRPSVDDIDHIVIKSDVQDWPPGYLPDPRAGGHAQALKEVRDLAKRRGIPVSP
jgi:hypothetical protein